MAETQKKNQTILCCDDEQTFCDLVAEELESHGYKTLKANSGNEAFEIFLKHKLSLNAVISDIRMPNGDGFGLLKKIRKVSPTQPVFLFLSGYSDYGEKDAFGEGADAVLTKPIDFDELVGVLETRLRSPEIALGEPLSVKHNELKISYISSSLEDAMKEKMLALGRRGIFLFVDGMLPAIGEVVRFSIQFSNSLPFQGSAVCRWLSYEKDPRGYCGVGLEFLSLDADSLTRFLDFVEENKPVSVIPNIHV